MKRQINTRFLLWTLGTFVALAGLVHWLHAYQVRQNAAALLQQAQTALDKGDRGRALAYWRQYLAFEPDDLNVLVKYGLTLDDGAASLRDRFEAWRVMNKVLARDPMRDDVRFRLTFCEISLGLYREAINDLKIILPRWQTNPAELEHVLGWCYDAVEDYDQASEAFARAIRKDPARIPSYVLRAEVLRHRLEQPEEADLVMEAVVKANPRNPRASLAAAQYHRQHNRLDKAGQEIQRALALESATPQERADLLAAAADLALVQGDPSRARALAEEGLQRHPAHVGLWMVLAGIDLRAGKRHEAIAHLRRGLEKQPDHADLNVLLADLLIDEAALAEVERLVARLRRKGVTPALLDYLQARILTTREQWEAATTLLERARDQLGPTSNWVSQVNAVLGLCYEKLGDTEQQLSAFARAVAQGPSWTQARLGLAAALLAAGRPDEALEHYRLASKAPDAPPDIDTLLARALLVRTLGLPVQQRDWSEVQQAIEQAAQRSKDGAQIALLRADLLVAQNDFPSARQALLQARAKNPENVSLWCALVDLAARAGRPQDGFALLAEANKALGDRVELRLAHARLEALLRGLDARPALEALTTNTDALPDADQVRLLREMADLWLRLGDRAAAERCLRPVIARQPHDLRARVLLLDLVLQTGRSDDARQLVTDLRRIEGKHGSWWRYGEAALWVLLARQDPKGVDRRRLADARNRLAELGRQRPDWARIPLLEARIGELEGDHELATQRYVRAIELGEREPRMIARLVNLLFERRDFVRADQALRRLEHDGTLGKDLTRLGAEIALANRDAARALHFAAQTVPATTRDYRELLWLARIQRAAGRSATAHETLRLAVTCGPHTPEPWLALVEFLVRADKIADAERILREAQDKLPSDRLGLVLGRGYELLGRLDQAEEVFQKAALTQPHDFGVVLEAVDFYRRSDLPRKAEPLLRRLLDPAVSAPGNVAARARRELAVVLAGSAKDSEALALLDENRRGSGISTSDDRARALVLAHQPSQHAKAIALFEKTLRTSPSADEHFWLVQLYDLVDQPAKARAEMVALLTAHGDNPQFLAYHIRRLLQREELSDAETYLERLQRLEPSSPRTQALQAALRQALSAN